jgi:hypothetical protein
MNLVKSKITGTGVTTGEVYFCMDYIRNDDNTLTAVIQDSDGRRHYLNQDNYENVI